jgi:hypothetical protein
MKYYIESTSFNRPQNKAREDIQKYLRQFFNMLVNSDDELNLLLKRIGQEVEATNDRYRNCRAMSFRFDNYKASDSINAWISVANKVDSVFSSLHARKVYKEYRQGFIQNFLL